MSDGRFLIIQYCDDVRQEIGNKYSLIGCYGDDLLLERFPALLPKFCAQVKATTPRDTPFQKLVVRAFMNDTQIGELEIPTAALIQAMDVVRREDLQVLTYNVFMTFSPLAIEEECLLRIEAESEAGALVGAPISIRIHPNQAPAA